MKTQDNRNKIVSIVPPTYKLLLFREAGVGAFIERAVYG